MSTFTGAQLRQSRIINPDTGKGIVVAMDHGLFLGPLPGIENACAAIDRLLPGHPDAIQMSPGITRAASDRFRGRNKPGVIVRIDATNIWRKKPAPLEGYYTYVATVKDAIQLGADAVVTFLFAGHETDAQEADNMQALARIAAECREYGIPFIVEPLAIKKGVNVVRDFEIMKLVIRMASEIGADLIKADFPENKKQFEELIGISTSPILVRGGPKMESDRDVLQMVKDAIDCGATGLVFGRNVWQHQDPPKMLRALAELVHEGGSVKKAVSIVKQ